MDIASPPVPRHLRGREIGRLRGASRGATLILVGGIHGNEPAGAIAACRVLDTIGERSLERELRGEVVALAGNLEAMRAKRRFHRKDLNRQWTEERAARLGRASAHDHHHDEEDREQRELYAAIESVIDRARGDVYLMDLHTTSAHGYPFVLFGDTPRQRRFARAFPLPIILGLEEQVDGVITEHFTRRGCITLGIEGGQHDDEGSVDNLAAAIWIALGATGIAERAAILHDLASATALLEARRGVLPRVIEVLERHAIRPDDEFEMAPGFANLAPVQRGVLLARDRRGEIRAPSDGVVILPLYQGQGEDGFFWGRAPGDLALRLADAVRALELARALRWLPGVRHDPARPDHLELDPAVARFYPRDVFHALGYRRVRKRGGVLTIARQRERR
jgi:succinylglutamate desuccinylase